MKLNELTANKLIEKLNNKEITSQDILLSLEQRIKEIDSKVKAYIRGEDFDFSNLQPTTYNLQPILKGIPVSIKDNICTKDFNTECCSKILEGFSPPYDATVIKKLKSAGAIIFPLKTNMDEFAFGSSTENSCFGPTHNPWDLERVVGGSSGGSAACVCADEAIFSLGSDTGGSIRQPASFCGVVGLKPTYGRVSRFGLIAFASSLDVIGPITKDVRDCALLMNVISGFDENDSTSVNLPVPDYTKALINDVKGIRIGVPKEYFVKGMSEEVKDIVWKAILLLEKLGVTYKEVSLPHTEYAIPVYYILATAEASSNLARFDGVQYGYRYRRETRPISDGYPEKPVTRKDSLVNMYKNTRGEGFGEEAKRRILLGTFALAEGYYEAYYLRALKVRTLIKKDFDEVFGEFDCIVTPTSPTPAFKIGEKIDDPLKMYLSDIYTISANLAGIPAISVPCGFTKDGLPVGLQILAKHFNEEILFKVAYTYECNTGWHLKRPTL